MDKRIILGLILVLIAGYCFADILPEPRIDPVNVTDSNLTSDVNADANVASPLPIPYVETGIILVAAVIIGGVAFAIAKSMAAK
ncbi:MAG: hypothetical protein AABW59_03155 [archaeon]